MGSLIKIAVPDGIGPAMESLTKAILEEQPVDIYKFAYKHFQMKVQRRQEAVSSPEMDDVNTKSKQSTIEDNKKETVQNSSPIESNLEEPNTAEE